MSETGKCEHDWGHWYRWEYKSSGYDQTTLQYWSRVETRQARECAKCGWGQVAPMEKHEARVAADAYTSKVPA